MKQWIRGAGVAFTLVLALAGCQTTPADQWISTNLSPREKATLLVDQGIERYNKMADDDALDRIPLVRAVFKLALETWPQDPRAAEWIKKVDSFRDKRQTEVQIKAKTLAAKTNLTDKEKYALVLLVRQLQLLAPPDLDLTKLNAQVAPIRAEVVKKSTQALVDGEAALKTAKSDTEVAKDLGALHDAIAALRQIDPQNPEAAASAHRLSDLVAVKTKASLDLAWKSYQARSYASALKTLGLVENSLSGTGTMASDEVVNLHYKISFDWAKDLFSGKKYSEAGIRVNDALSVRATPEARDLRDKISAAALFRDYDAEYDGIDRQIEALVKDGDLKAAWAQVAATAQELKKDANKSRLDVRRKQVLDAVHDLYDSAVASYNDEDYQEAKAGFDTVNAVDPTWQLARAYQDKTRAKLQALGDN